MIVWHGPVFAVVNVNGGASVFLVQIRGNTFYHIWTTAMSLGCASNKQVLDYSTTSSNQWLILLVESKKQFYQHAITSPCADVVLTLPCDVAVVLRFIHTVVHSLSYPYTPRKKPPIVLSLFKYMLFKHKKTRSYGVPNCSQDTDIGVLPLSSASFCFDKKQRQK